MSVFSELYFLFCYQKQVPNYTYLNEIKRIVIFNVELFMAWPDFRKQQWVGEEGL